MAPSPVARHQRTTSAPRRGRPCSPRVDQAILAATLRLLGEVGYAQLTMEQVAARADVGKASLYLRWPSKDALIEHAIRQHGPIVAEVPDTGSLAEDMRHLLHALVRRRDPASTALPAIAGEAVRNPQLREVFRRAITAAVPAAVRTIVQRAIDRGELPSTSDVELLAALPLALLQHLHAISDQRPGTEVVDRIVAQFYTQRHMPDPHRRRKLKEGPFVSG
jgi:AcrR family transcriptional regulator